MSRSCCSTQCTCTAPACQMLLGMHNSAAQATPHLRGPAPGPPWSQLLLQVLLLQCSLLPDRQTQHAEHHWGAGPTTRAASAWLPTLPCPSTQGRHRSGRLPALQCHTCSIQEAIPTLAQCSAQCVCRALSDYENALYGPEFADPRLGWRKFANETTFLDWFIVTEIVKNAKHGYHSTVWMSKVGHPAAQPWILCIHIPVYMYIHMTYTYIHKAGVAAPQLMTALTCAAASCRAAQGTGLALNQTVSSART